MEYVIGLIAVLIGAVFYYKNSSSSAKGLLQNLETAVKDLTQKEELFKEAAKKEVLQEELKEVDSNEKQAKEEAKSSDVDDNLKFWNKPRK